MQDVTRQTIGSRSRLSPGLGRGRVERSARCPACGGDILTANLDQPPLWPRLLGGADAPAPFGSGAYCVGCARLSEAAIDDTFLKNWSMQSQQVRSALTFLDRETPLAAPLTYLGLAADYQGEVGTFCERWAGMAGEQIFHIHSNPAPLWGGHAGAYAHASRVDHGVVNLRLSDASAYWRQVANLSVAAYFPLARRFIVDPDQNGGRGQPGNIAFESLFAPRQQAWFRSAHLGRLTLHPDLAQRGPQRFLIKLALALGHRLFGPAFMRTSHARRLRRNFWSASPQVRSGNLAEDLARTAAIHGCAVEKIGVGGAWTMVIGAFGGEYGLCLITPSGQAMQVVIADDPALWAEAPVAMAYVAVPIRRIFLGPLPLETLAHHQGGRRAEPALARLDAMRLTPSQLPTRRGLM